jgi:asparagine synthase (glutamine-hydrolysing)
MVAPFVPPAIWRALRRFTGRAAGLGSYSAVNQQRLAELANVGQKHSISSAERPVLDPLKGRIEALNYGDGGGNAYKGVLAQWGLSIREPAADRRIVEYCLATPIEEFVRDGVPRSLARRAFSDRLPSIVTQNRVRGCQASDWYEAVNTARPEIEGEIEAFFRCAEAREALDPSWFGESLDAWPTGDWNSSVSYRRYRIGLLRGVAAGHFMRKVAGTN